MSLSPQDGIAWVTGASQGIGKATCQRLARDGWTVLASARNAEALADLCRTAQGEPGQIVAHPLDVTEPGAVGNAVTRMAQAYGPPALAILNAGTYVPDSAETLSPESLDPTLALNLVSTARCVEALLPHMKRAGRGHIQIVSSLTGYRGLPNAVSYGASKAALINMAESLKLDFDRMGLRLQLVNPGFVKTPLTDRNTFSMPFLISADEAADRMVRAISQSRFEIVFPRRFAYLLKVMRCLPYFLYFPIVKRMTRTK